MKIAEFVESLQVNPTAEFLKKFKLDKTYNKSFNYSRDKHPCLNCDDELNNIYLPSAPWTSTQYCWKCHHLNIVFRQDKMSGIDYDVIECYSDKD